MVRQCAACSGWCNDFSASQFSKGPSIRRCIHCIEEQRYPHSHNPELIEASRQRVADRGGDSHNPPERAFLADLKATIDSTKGGIDLDDLARKVPYATWWRVQTNIEKTLRTVQEHPNDFEVIAMDHRGEHRAPAMINKAVDLVLNHETYKVEEQLKIDKDDHEWCLKNPEWGIAFDEWHKGFVRTEEHNKADEAKNQRDWKTWDKWYEGWHYFPGKGWTEVDPTFLMHPENPLKYAPQRATEDPIGALPDIVMN